MERDAYRIEKIIFESRPAFPVTANLYVPKDVDLPRPGVVGCCGHSNNGKAEAAYQSFAQGLARLGYVCLIYDPIGQGERLQYVQEDLSSRIGVGVPEHLYAGNQQFLVGEFFGMWRAWDGIRALDYLLTRSEVDPQHVGVTGNSGGGTLTTWLCGLDSRWTMAAPSCFVTTFLHNMENELPADTEQCPPKALALGLDHVDFLAALAPKPVAILAQERDFFDVRGSYDELQTTQTALPTARPGTERRPVRGPQTTRLYAGEPRVHVRVVRQGHQQFTRPGGTRDDDRRGPDVVVHTAGASLHTRKHPDRVHAHARQIAAVGAAARRERGETLLQAVKTVLKLPAEYFSGSNPARTELPHLAVYQRGRVSVPLCLYLRRRHRAGHHGPGVLAHEGELGIASFTSGRTGHSLCGASLERRGAATGNADSRSAAERTRSHPCSRVMSAASGNRCPIRAVPTHSISRTGAISSMPATV